MIVRVFTADSMQNAMMQVKSKLGRDAVILHTRKLRKGGFLGFFAKEMVEVMAAVDTPAATARENISVSEPIEKAVVNNEKNDVQTEIADMKKLLEQVVSSMPKDDKESSPFLELLLSNDIERNIAEELLQDLQKEQQENGGNTANNSQILIDKLKQYFGKIEGINISPSETKIVAFIGPTGVGKTTTIAKLAADFAIKQDCRVALITADTYRISAVEQLKTYSDIMGIHVEVVYTPEDLKQAIANNSDKDLILIDTAGRSPRNKLQMEELQLLLKAEPKIETHLVLSATTKYKDAMDLVNKFAVCKPQKVLFTKIDEASNIGTIFNIIHQFPISLSYVATGQNVPDDIELANPNKLVEMILRD